MAPVMDVTSEAQLDRILTSLDEDKAEEIVQVDLRGKSAMADYMVICSGRSSRHPTQGKRPRSIGAFLKGVGP